MIVLGPEQALSLSVMVEQASAHDAPSLVVLPAASVADAGELNFQIGELGIPHAPVTQLAARVQKLAGGQLVNLALPKPFGDLLLAG